MTKIFAFPPVGTVLVRWTRQQPVQRSRSMFTGRHYVSALGPARVSAAVQVSALAKGRNGAGYCQSLWHLLDGGVHLVSLLSPPANWHLDAQSEWGWGAPGGFSGLGTQPLGWTASAAPLGWTAGGAPLVWFSGSLAQGTPGEDAQGHFITVTGLPQSRQVVRPYEVVRSYPPGSALGVAARAVTAAHSDESGVAVVRLHSALPAGTISLGGAEKKTFRVENTPESAQPVGANWTISWEFSEVLPNEISSPVEVNPW